MKYFTKYLPVEGEIKENDKYLFGGRVLTAPKVFAEHDEGSDGHRQKVKLFLCSRDIGIGDKYYPHTIWFEKDRDRPLEMTKTHHLTENCFKVIGEVSPEAIWVKEGMEFDEYQEWWFAPQTNMFIWKVSSNGRIDDIKKHQMLIKKAETKIKLKCPTCKTFH